MGSMGYLTNTLRDITAKTLRVNKFVRPQFAKKSMRGSNDKEFLQ